MVPWKSLLDLCGGGPGALLPCCDDVGKVVKQLDHFPAQPQSTEHDDRCNDDITVLSGATADSLLSYEDQHGQLSTARSFQRR